MKLLGKHGRRFSLLLRVAVACAGAGALALTAGRVSRSPAKPDARTARPERARFAASKIAAPGPDTDHGPTGAADDDYAHRAYPASDVPFALTKDAERAWQRLKAAKSQKGKNTPGAWTLAGPSNATFPDVLTFSGAQYTTSGRITALEIDPACSTGSCTLWAAAAGGGVWRTDNALSGNGPSWAFVSASFSTNAIGTLSYDAATNTLYAGTGEPNASSDSEAGFGIYKSTDRGLTWTHLAAQTSVPAGAGVDCDAVFGAGSGGVLSAPAYSGPAFDGRAVSSILLDGGTMYVGSARGVRGVSSVTSGGAVSLAPGLPPFGLWKSTDGGASFTLLNYVDVCINNTLAGFAGIVQSSFGSTRGVTQIAFDPSAKSTLYASPFPQTSAIPLATGGGVWRSTDSGSTWTQIKSARNPANSGDRAAFAVTKLDNGKTRMYVGVGNTSIAATSQAHFYRTDDAAAGSPVFTDLTAIQQASAAPNQTLDYCGSFAVGGAQCSYDNFVVSPAGNPDMVYIGGAYDYDTFGFRSNGRAVLLSTDGGLTFADQTWDGTTGATPPATCCQANAIAPNGIHPDEHTLVTAPFNPKLFFEGSDGGVVRSSGALTDISYQCAQRSSLAGADVATCNQLLSAVPTRIYSLNKGLSTLQFQSLSVAADDAKHLMGGTQDNGTWEGAGSSVFWPQIMYGDGGQSGFHAADSTIRFNSFTSNAHDANFRNGDPTKWVIIGGPIRASRESAQFYSPIISDPAAPGTIFEGSLSVWRTQDWGGNPATLEANCPEFTHSSADPACGDFVPLGPSGAGATRLTTAAADYRGTTRAGGNLAAVSRTASDTSTLWAATTAGRVFVSKNADAADNTSVTFTRIDGLDAASPARFVSGIAIDPANANHAWLSYSSYSSLTPATPGHVFSVLYDPGAGTATWTNLDAPGGTAFPDFPATAIAYDSVRGDLYVANDWGVVRLPSGGTSWQVAGTGLPQVEVAGLTIVPAARKLYAATHGRSAWQLTLP